MDEESLEAAIATYTGQLQQVEVALQAGLDPSQQPDLLKLKEDLSQLIELTESSLVSVKKSHLLASLEETITPQTNSEGSTSNGYIDAEFAAFYSEVGETSSSNTFEDNDKEGSEEGYDEEDEEEEDLSGTKVRAPYRTTWGTLEYHNAMVVGSEPTEGEESCVRVFYIYPTQKSMKPCPFYLEDKCRFPDNCRFSHGETVLVSELREFVESNLSKLEEGSSCLARHEDGIWYPAKITDIDNGFYTVKFDSVLLKDAVVEADGLIPPMREDDPLTSDSEDEDYDDDDDAAYAKVLDSAGDSTTLLSSAEFGGWEAHTRGIGSKLMLKMGYEYGKGLGKTQEGRVEPVIAMLLPKGKSLDMCVELTQRRGHSRAAKDGTLKRPKKRRKPRVNTGGRQTVFDFLNHKLGGKNDHTTAAGEGSSLTGVEAYRGSSSTKRSLNVRLFQASERVTQTEREILKISETLSRQTGRDASRVKQLEEKLTATRRVLAQQKAQEQSIQKEHRKADTHKKMTEF